MSESLKATIQGICGACGNDRGRMMDIVRCRCSREGCVSARRPSTSSPKPSTATASKWRPSSASTRFSRRGPRARSSSASARTPIDQMKGAEAVAEALVDELGIEFGQTTEDGTITLEKTPCIGMCDQAPAALINDEVVTYLGPDQARQIVGKLKADPDSKKIIGRLGRREQRQRPRPLDGSQQHSQLRRGHLRGVHARGGAEERPGDEPGRGSSAT